MAAFSQLPFVTAIGYAGMTSISFTIIGSAFLIISVLPQAFPVLAGIWAVSFDKVQAIYMLAYHASMGIIALYFLLAVTFDYARSYESKGIDVKPMNASLMALFLYFLLIPQVTFENGLFALVNDPANAIINGWEIGSDGVSRLAATGIFTAFIVAFVTVRLYVFCVKKHIVITLPDEVPDGVARSFTALIPVLFLSLLGMVVNGVLFSFELDVFQLIAIPFGFVVDLTNSWYGIIVIYFLIHILWLVGIHGATIITSIIQPITLANLAANAQGANYALAGEFNNAFVTIGGSGATLGLTIFCCFLARSEQLKYVGRAEIVPAIFNINEPMLFGLPLVFNMDLALPFFLAPVASALVGYTAITTHLVPACVAMQPWPTPIGLSGLIATAGDWRGAVLSVVCAVVAAAIYFPFFKRYDKKTLEQEKEAAGA